MNLPKSKYFLPMNLQHFADPTPPEPPAPPAPEPPADPAPPEPPKPDDKKYTQKEFEAEIARRVASEKKRADEKVAEAEKLAKMNADQKKEYETEKLQKELEDYKKKDAFYSLSKEASKMLSEKGITADDDVLDFVVKGTAEATQTSVNSFVALVNSKVEEGVKKALSGKPPKATPGTPPASVGEGFAQQANKQGEPVKNTIWG